MQDPDAITIDSSGNIYITSNSYIFKYDLSGSFLQKIGTEGSGDGQFYYPNGIAFDSSDNIYVADGGNNRIQKFDSNWNFIAKWGANGGDGTQGTGDGEFYSPFGIITDSSDNIYVTDQADRIQKFDSSGNYISSFGAHGSGPGEFDEPIDIAMDTSGNFYVLDSSLGTVQKFNSSGVYQSQFGSQGSGDGQFSSPKGIALDSLGNIYIADYINNRIQKFNSSGVYQSQFGSPGPEDGQFENPSSITFDSSDNIYITDTNNNRIQQFDSNGNFLSKIEASFEDAIFSYGIDVAPDGGIYAAQIPGGEGGQSSIGHYSANGNLVSNWSIEAGEYPYSVAVSPTHIYSVVIVSGDEDITSKIQKRDFSGNLITEWNQPESAFGMGTAIDSHENVYLADADNNQVIKFSSDGALLGQFAIPDSIEGDTAVFPYTGNSIAFDSQDNLYIAGSDTNRVQKLDIDGNLLATIGSEGSGDGEFATVASVAIGSDDSIYASDCQSEGFCRIQKFNSNGQYITQYTQGMDETTSGAWSPYAVSTGPNGRIYAADVDDGKIDILCDQAVSTDGCATTGGGDSGVELTSAENGTPIVLSQSGCSTVSSSSVSKESSNGVQDAGYSYPLGLVGFNLTGCDTGGTATITLTFTGSYNPSNTTVRKYNTTTNAYTTLTQSNSNLSLSTTTLNNNQALQVTYTITDGGLLDQDGQVNGSIVDPVGIATQSTGAADTGLNRYWLTNLK